MGVNIPCHVEKFDPSREPSVVDAKRDRQKKSFKIYNYLTALGNVHEVCEKALLLHCGGQELQDGFSKLLMNSL